MIRRIWCGIPLLLLAGCATPTLQTAQGSSAAVAQEAETQRRYIIQNLVDEDSQMERVMYRLNAGAVDLCGSHTGGDLGVAVMTGSGFARDFRDVAQRYFQLGDGYTIVALLPGGPADRAGLKAGDRLMGINGDSVGATAKGVRAWRAALKKGADGNMPVTIAVQRDGAPRDIALVPARVCDYPGVFVQDKQVNAAADGEEIMINSGTMDFVHSDEELATVLSHELAHNVLGHSADKKRNAAVGGALGLAADILLAATTGVNPGLTRAGLNAGAGAYSIQFEQEADYEGLYLMQRAGFAIDDAPNFWRRTAVDRPELVTLRSDHPTNPERFVALSNTIAEIKAKQAAGQPLLPNTLPTNAPSTPKPATR